MSSKSLSNRANAQHSTGPKSNDGKAKVAKNAIKHGLLAAHCILSDENPEEFEMLKNATIEELSPETISQTFQAGRIAEMRWKRLRFDRVESELFELSFFGAKVKEAENAMNQYLEIQYPETLDLSYLQPKITVLDDERYKQAKAQYDELNEMIKGLSFAYADAFTDFQSKTTFINIMRYRAANDRQLEKALHAYYNMKGFADFKA